MLAQNTYLHHLVALFVIYTQVHHHEQVRKTEIEKAIRSLVEEFDQAQVNQVAPAWETSAGVTKFPSIVRQFFQDYRVSQAGVALHKYLLALQNSGRLPATVKNYRSDIGQFLNFAPAKSPDQLVQKSEVARFLEFEQQRGSSQATIHRKVASLSQFFQWLQENGWLTTNLWKSFSSTSFSELLKTDKPVRELTTLSDQTDERPAAWSLPLKNIDIQAYLPQQFQNSLARAVKKTPVLTRLRKAISAQPLLGYFNLAMGIIFFLGAGFLGYRQFFSETSSSLAFPTSLTRPNRSLSFQGRLTSATRSPITSITPMRFKLYDSGPATGSGNLLWDSNSCNIDPDQDGIFSTTLGDACGTEITSDVFTEHSNVWLEVQVNSEILAPRQSIKTVAYALNSETLQGYPASASAVENTVVIMRNDGKVVFGNANPILEATGDSFTLTANTLTLETSSGSNGDVIINPDGTGQTLINSNTIIDGYLYAPGATLSATYAGGTALTLKAGPSATGDIMQWQSSAGSPLGVIDKSGNIGIGTTVARASLEIAGTASSSGTLTFKGTTDPKIDILNGESFGLRTSVGGDVGLTERLTILNNGNIGIGSTTPSQVLDVVGGIRLGAADAENVLNTSTAGGAPSGNLYWGDRTVCDSTGNCSTVDSNWSIAGGSIYPKNTTLDMFIGGIASASAKFAFLNVNSGIPTASIAGNLALAAPTGADPATKLNVYNGGSFGLRTSVGGDAGLAERLTVLNNGNVGIGTTSPVAKLEITDSSSITSLGSEMITNADDRTFASDLSHWSGTNWSIGSGVATHTAGANAYTLSNTYLTSAPEASAVYLVKLTATTTTTGTLTISFGGTTAGVVGYSTGTIYPSYVVVATNTNPLTITPNTAWEGSIDNVSIKKYTTFSSVALQLNQSDGNTAPIQFRTGANNGQSLFIGNNSGQYANTYEVTDSVAIGTSTLRKAQEYGYVAIGANALQNVTDGAFDNAVGMTSLGSLITGYHNNAMGYQSLYALKTGSNNTAIGGSIGSNNFNGIFNTENNSLFGFQAAHNLGSNSTNNVILGTQAGYNIGSGSNNIFLGYQAGYSETGSNKLYIDNSNTSSPLIWGDFASNYINVNGNLGIGSTAPSQKLDVVGGIRLGTADAENVLNTSTAGGAPSGNLYWGDRTVCDSTGNCSVVDSNWTVGSGIIYPKNATLDMFIGGTASSSAKFAFLNVNSGTPTASIAGNLALAAPTGADPATKLNVYNGGSFGIQTSVGGDVGLTERLTILNNGNVGIGTTNPVNILDVNGTVNTNSSSFYKIGNNKIIDIENDGTLLVGVGAGLILPSGVDYNTLIGASAGASINNSAADGNTMMGYLSGNQTTTGSINTYIGKSSGYAHQTSYGNVFVGESAGSGFSIMSSANYNTGVGSYSLQNISGGSDYNQTFGAQSGYYLTTTSDNNVFIGNKSGYGVSYYYGNSSNNTFVGSESGYSIGNNQSNNIFIGYQAGYNETGSNKLYIDSSNTSTPLIWGDFASDYVNINGNLGIGSTAPSQKLDVVGGIRLGAADAENVLNTSTAGGAPSGNLYWGDRTVCDSTGNCSTVDSNWTVGSGIIYPKNATLDMFIGGTASASAKFAFLNVNSGIPTASIAGNLALAAPTGADPATKLNVYNGGSYGIQTSVGGDVGLTERLTILNNGNVGIGSTTPGAKLDVNGIIYSIAGGGGGFRFSDDNNTGFYSPSSDQIIFMGNGQSSLYVDGSSGQGELGVFTDPNAVLDVWAANAYASNIFEIGRDTGANPGGQMYLILGTSGITKLSPYNTDSTAPFEIEIGSTGDSSVLFDSDGDEYTIGIDSSDADKFKISDNTALGTNDRFTIDSTGNIGIGTTAPASLLDIGNAGSLLGTLRLAGNTSGYVQIQPSAAAGSWTLTLPANDGDSGQVLTTNGSGVASWAAAAGGSNWTLGSGFLHPNNPTTDLFIGGYATASAKFAFLNVNSGIPTASISGNLALATPTGADPATKLNVYNGGSFSLQTSVGGDVGLTERLTILNNGNVGIGTTSPVTKLQATTDDSTNNGVSTVARFTHTTSGSPAVGIGTGVDFAAESDGTPDVYLGSMRFYLNDVTDAGGLATAFQVFGNNGYGSGTLNDSLIAISETVGSTAVGSGALGGSSFTGINNTGMGAQAGSAISSGYQNTLLGTQAGYSLTTQSNNTLIGYKAGFSSTGESNVFLGANAGTNETGSNLLYIDNSTTSTPLIWGDFASDYVNINGNLGIGSTAPSQKLDVVGAIRLGAVGANNILNTTIAGGAPSGNLYWGNRTVCDSSGSCGGSGTWTIGSGIMYPINNTVDVLIGGVSSTSAKFAFLNVNSGSPTATIAGNLSLVVPTGSTPATKLNIFNGGTFSIQNSVGGDTGLATSFSVSPAQITSVLPHQFTAAGDVSMAYDLIFTNQTSSEIQTNGPFTIKTGEPWESNNLTLNTYGSGNLLANLGDTGKFQITSADPSIILDAKTATDTDFWLGVQEDAGGDDDDIFSIGDGTTIGTNSFFSINTAGNVGIGSTAPSSSLEVAGSIELANYLYFGNSTSEYLRWDGSDFLVSDDFLPNANDSLNLGATGARWADLYLGPETLHIGSTTSDEGTISYDTTGDIFNFGTDSTTNGDIAFFTDDLYLDKASGNVGIGSTTPSQVLDVVGGIRLGAADAENVLHTTVAGGAPSGNLYWGNRTVCDSTGNCGGGSSNWTLGAGFIHPINPSVDLFIGGTASASAKFAFLNVNSGIPTASIAGNLALAAPTGASPANKLNVYNGGSFGLRTSVGGDAGLTERLTVLNNGNVGIGTTSPTAKLNIGAVTVTDNQTDYMIKTNITAGGTSNPATVYGIHNTVTGNQGANGNTAYGLYNLVSGTSASLDWSDVYAIYNDITSINYSVVYGNYVELNTNYVSGTAYANYVKTETGSVGNHYAYYADMTLGSGLDWGLYLTGEAKNYFSGKVGIGSTAPATSLDVTGDIGLRSGKVLRLYTSGDSTYNVIYSTAANLYMNSGNGEVITQAVSNIDFQTWTASSYNSKMTITNAGNVGIGTTGPGYKLEVAGNTKSNSYYLTDTWNISSDASYLRFNSGITGQAYISLNGQLLGGLGSASAPTFTQSSSLNTGMFFPSSSQLGFTISGSEKVRIISSGNVGIGTTNPLKLLDVRGSATISGTLQLAPNVAVNAGTCNASAKGTQYYNGTDNKMYYCNGTAWTAMGVGDVKLETFTGDGTYTPTSDTVLTIVEAIGPGGGGGGGGSIATGTARTGGGGGGGGAYTTKTFSAANVTPNVSIVVPTGGVGGNGGTNAAGSDGAAASADTSFGSLLVAYKGGGGGNGTVTTTLAGGGGGGGSGAAGTSSTNQTGQAGGGPGGGAAGASVDGLGGGGGGTAATGGNSSWGGGGGGGSRLGGTAGDAGGSSLRGGGGGGGGGSCAASCTSTNGGAGGNVPGATAGGGGAAGSGGGGGGNGTDNATGIGGDGGGGGGSNQTAGSSAGAGGNGGAPGGGGGGGGAATYSSTGTGGKGGDGGRGEVRVWSVKGSGADYAELYSSHDVTLEPGDVVALDSSLKAGVKKSTSPYENGLLGIISTLPGQVVGSVDDQAEKVVIVALAGRVPTKVSTENGPIKAGDFLTASSIPGVAMKATSVGLTVGTAIEDYNGAVGEVGNISVFVNTTYTSGLLLKQVLASHGVEIPESVWRSNTIDYSWYVLATMLEKQEEIKNKPILTETYVDRLVAGLELITPRLVTQSTYTNEVHALPGSDLNFYLPETSKLSIRKEQIEGSPPDLTELFSFDSSGNASVSGTLVAQSLRAETIDGLLFNSSGELLLNKSDEDFQVTPIGGSALTKVIGAAKAVIGRIQAGAINAQELLVSGQAYINNLSVNDFSINGQSLRDYVVSIIQENQATNPVIAEVSPTPAPTGTASGSAWLAAIFQQDQDTGQPIVENLNVSDTLSVEAIEVASVSAQLLEVSGQTMLGSLLINQNASVAGVFTTNELDANSARIDALEAGMAQFDSVRATTAEFANATISGTLYAETITDLDKQIAELLGQPALMDVITGNIPSPQNDFSSLYQVLGSISSTASQAGQLNQSVADLNLADDDVVLDASAGFIDRYFKVNGVAYVGDSLGVGNTLRVGQKLELTDTYLSFSTGADTPDESPIFFIQPSGKGLLALMGGLMTLDETGQVTINGNLHVAGDVSVEGSLLANVIEPLNQGESLKLNLGPSNTGLEATMAGTLASPSGQLEVLGDAGTPVATVSAQGKASFSSLSLGRDLLARPSVAGAATESSQLTQEATQTTGRATLPAGNRDLIIRNPYVRRDSLIYLTPLNSTNNQVLYVNHIEAPADEATAQVTDERSFTVSLDNVTASDISFTWWIVN